MSMRWCRLYRGTAAEHSLEDAVAAIGVPYRTQFPGFLYGSRYFCDFYLPTLKLVIEVDDPSHKKPDKMLADAERTLILESEWGVTVVRCTNEEALNDPYGTVKRLLKQARLELTSTPTLAASLPEPKKAPQKARRESIREQRQYKRNKRKG
jgi:very-short-patch-repair endonuclease